MTRTAVDLFDRYDHLGSFNPYCFQGSTRLEIDPSLPGILGRFDGPRIIDPISVIEIITRGYCFAERTLVQGIQRTPWMARPNEARTAWIYADLPTHGDKVAVPEEIADGLFSRLCTELAEFCDGRATVGVLLSGGMDSRVVACVLDHLRRTGQIRSVLVGITWGLPGSRDVLYARRITDLLGWEFRHFPIGPDNLIENLSLTAERGCEFIPYHLHAMPRVRNTPGLDGMVGASYGDSVGRAEFSGFHITRIRPLDRQLRNRFKLLRELVFRDHAPGVHEDTDGIHRRFSRSQPYQQYEVDNESHYMQRMLNPCMAIINEKIPFFQAFTSPAVFGYMWSFSPTVRTDDIYLHLLSRSRKDLLEIPWARTGRRYLSQEGPADEHDTHFNAYGLWVRRALRELVRERLFSGAIEGLGIFNMKSLESLFWVSQFSKRRLLTQIEKVLLWLASVAEFTERYQLQGGCEQENSRLREVIDGRMLSLCHHVGFSGKQAAIRTGKTLREWIHF